MFSCIHLHAQVRDSRQLQNSFGIAFKKLHSKLYVTRDIQGMTSSQTTENSPWAEREEVLCTDLTKEAEMRK